MEAAHFMPLECLLTHCHSCRPGCSYVDVVLNPIADAIAAATMPGTQVWVTMQGEMGVRVAAVLPHLLLPEPLP